MVRTPKSRARGCAAPAATPFAAPLVKPATRYQKMYGTDIDIDSVRHRPVISPPHPVQKLTNDQVYQFVIPAVKRMGDVTNKRVLKAIEKLTELGWHCGKTNTAYFYKGQKTHLVRDRAPAHPASFPARARA